MPTPRYEVPVGAIDGVNMVFTVSVPYKPGTTAVFLNGLLMGPLLDDGWVETDPLAGVVTLKEPPRVTKICPDVVQVFFVDTSPVSPETVVTTLHGKLVETGTLEGRLSQESSLLGELVPALSLEGHMTADAPLVGVVEPVGTLHGQVEVVCG